MPLPIIITVFLYRAYLRGEVSVFFEGKNLNGLNKTKKQPKNNQKTAKKNNQKKRRKRMNTAGKYDN